MCLSLSSRCQPELRQESFSRSQNRPSTSTMGMGRLSALTPSDAVRNAEKLSSTPQLGMDKHV